MTTFTETLKAGSYLVSEANGHLSREQVTLTGGPYDAGQVLGKKLGTQHVAAAVGFAGNTGGAGTVGSLTADAGVMAGDWKIVVIEPATNAGTFEVIRPDGTVEGTGHVASAYNGELNFTISDATDFVSGDGFTIAVSYDASDVYAIHDPSATDGSQKAAGILYAAADGSDDDIEVTITARSAEVNGSELLWKSGTTDDQKTAALAQLAALSIIAR